MSGDDRDEVLAERLFMAASEHRCAEVLLARRDASRSTVVRDGFTVTTVWPLSRERMRARDRAEACEAALRQLRLRRRP